jgi:hypothetical protein
MVGVDFYTLAISHLYICLIYMLVAAQEMRRHRGGASVESEAAGPTRSETRKRNA